MHIMAWFSWIFIYYVVESKLLSTTSHAITNIYLINLWVMQRFLSTLVFKQVVMATVVVEGPYLKVVVIGFIMLFDGSAHTEE